MKTKSPGVAVILSLIFPGAGSMYCEKIGKGILYFVAINFTWVMGAVALNRGMGLRPDWGTAVFFLISALVVGISSTVSAYNDANKYNDANNDANVEKPAVESPKVVSHEYQPLTGIKRLV